MGDPGVDRQHLIFISSCHTTQIHTLSFPTFGLTRSFRGSSRPGSIISSHLLPTLLELNVEGTRGEIVAASPIALQSRCQRVPNEPIPTYGHSWQQHQQKTFPSGRNGSVRVDAVRQCRQRHPGGGLLRARRQYHASHCISPSDRRFAVSSGSVGLLF